MMPMKTAFMIFGNGSRLNHAKDINPTLLRMRVEDIYCVDSASLFFSEDSPIRGRARAQVCGLYRYPVSLKIRAERLQRQLPDS